MKRLRIVEETIANRYAEQNMRCPVHLSIGQELVPAIIGLFTDKTDYAVSTHRGHAHYLGKGGDLRAMIAEIYGKVTGCSRGRGGSMHLIDESVGFMGTTAIVGNSIPIGVGLAWAAKLDADKSISCIFLGDGAVEEGVFYESVNFAAVKKLPALFICENNLYSVYSPLSVRQPEGRIIHEMVKGMGIRVFSVNGTDIQETYQTLQDSVNYVREHNLPAFVEISTYRWREHCGPNFDNNIGYRNEKEFEDWQSVDPLDCLEKKFLTDPGIDPLKIANLVSEIQLEVDEAFEFAINSEFPGQSEAYIDEYSG